MIRYFSDIDWISVAMIAAAGLICLIIGLLIYEEAGSEKFYLRKDQWECTNSKIVSSGYMQIVGNGQMIWIPTTTVECQEWKRK